MASGLGLALRNRKLRRAELAWFLGQAGRWAWAGIVSLLAFDAAGAAGVGLVLLCRQVPGVFAIPPATYLAERWRRDRVMAGLATLRATAVLGAVFAVAADAPIGVYCVLAVVEGLGTSAVRPLHKALLPWLANSVRELSAANALTAIGETLGVILGAGVASVLLAIFGTQVSVALCAALLFSAVPLILMINVDRTLRMTRDAESFGATLLTGFRYLGQDRTVGGLIASSVVINVLIGGAFVFFTALAQEEFGLGDSGPSVFLALTGVGGLIGGLGSVRLETRSRLVPVFSCSLAAMSLVGFVAGTVPNLGSTLGFVVVFGVAMSINAVVSVSLLQRAVPAEKLGFVFSVESMLAMVAVGAGGYAISALVDAVDLRPALIVVAVATVVMAVIFGLLLRSLDGRRLTENVAEETVEQMELFAGFPIATRQVLARLIDRRPVAAGETLIREGDPGDTFFLVGAGEFLATSEKGDVRRTMTAGDHFGEIALLRSVPRTASVTAVTAGIVWTLGRDEFLDVVSSNDSVQAAAETISSERLRGAPRPGAYAN